MSNLYTSSAVLTTARLVIDGGVDIIQLREKSITDREFIAISKELQKLTRASGVTLIINDRVHLVEQTGAQGVHIGQDDMPIEMARSLLGSEKIIGVSTHSPKQAIEAENNGADYIAIGPAFPTITKPHEPAVGVDTALEVGKRAKIPVFAIGGITLSNVGRIINGGISHIAVSSSIVNAKDVTDATKQFNKSLGKL